jgi:hypothetical protein
MLLRLADIMDPEPQVPPPIPVSQVRERPIRIEQTDDPTRLVQRDHLLDPGERAHQNAHGTGGQGSDIREQ